MKFQYFIVLFLMLSSCSTHTKQNAIVKEESNFTDATSDAASESIFNLASVWHTEEGNAIELKDLKGKALVMVMIYTSCKAACPRLVADMKALHDKVPINQKDAVQYVLVSIDPVHDTPQKLKQFAISKEMDGAEWTFLQGDPESVREFANVLSVKYKEILPMDFSHSNIISVFSQEGVLVYQQEGLGVDNNETVEAIIKTIEKK